MQPNHDEIGKQGFPASHMDKTVLLRGLHSFINSLDEIIKISYTLKQLDDEKRDRNIFLSQRNGAKFKVNPLLKNLL